jgi:hypothetical protein
MLERLKRKPGGQPGNRNAVKTGRWTAEGRAAHEAALAAAPAEWKEKQRRSDEWCRSRPSTDLFAIAESLRALRESVEIK